MTLSVIGAGYPRTGTMSLKLALEQLGFGPCHHMVEIFQHPEQAALWARVFDELQVDFDDVLRGYRSATDAPSCFVYKELVARYPQAKVILSIRDGESWWRSAQATVMSNANRDQMQNSPAASLLGPMFLKMRGYLAKHQGGALGDGDIPPDKDTAIAAFNRHNAEVQKLVPPERLLVFEAKQGWAPLCKFLGVPVPAGPYPRVNTTEEFHSVSRTFHGTEPTNRPKH